MEYSELNINDIICGRGSGPSEYIGNKRFRGLVAFYRGQYLETSNRTEKGQIARIVLDEVRNLQPPGRFVEKISGSGSLYRTVDNDKALEKVKQALRQIRHYDSNCTPQKSAHSISNTSISNTNPIDLQTYGYFNSAYPHSIDTPPVHGVSTRPPPRNPNGEHFIGPSDWPRPVIPNKNYFEFTPQNSFPTYIPTTESHIQHGQYGTHNAHVDTPFNDSKRSHQFSMQDPRMQHCHDLLDTAKEFPKDNDCEDGNKQITLNKTMVSSSNDLIHDKESGAAMENKPRKTQNNDNCERSMEMEVLLNSIRTIANNGGLHIDQNSSKHSFNIEGQRDRILSSYDTIQNINYKVIENIEEKNNKKCILSAATNAYQSTLKCSKDAGTTCFNERGSIEQESQNMFLHPRSIKEMLADNHTDSLRSMDSTMLKRLDSANMSDNGDSCDSMSLAYSVDLDIKNNSQPRSLRQIVTHTDSLKSIDLTMLKRFDSANGGETGDVIDNVSLDSEIIKVQPRSLKEIVADTEPDSLRSAESFLCRMDSNSSEV